MVEAKVVVVCGSRDWTNVDKISAKLSTLPPGTVIVHGNNGTVGRIVRGADKLAGMVAGTLGFAVRAYDADWSVHGKAAGPIRNRLMLETERPSLVIAFIRGDLSKSIGTRNCVTQAEKLGIEVHKIFD